MAGVAHVERLERYAKGVQQIGTLYKLLCMLNDLVRSQSDQNCKRKRLRYRDSELHFHAKRLRILWSPLVRSLGPTDFHKHHRISLELFNKIRYSYLCVNPLSQYKVYPFLDAC